MKMVEAANDLILSELLLIEQHNGRPEYKAHAVASLTAAKKVLHDSITAKPSEVREIIAMLERKIHGIDTAQTHKHPPIGSIASSMISARKKAVAKKAPAKKKAVKKAVRKTVVKKAASKKVRRRAR